MKHYFLLLISMIGIFYVNAQKDPGNHSEACASVELNNPPLSKNHTVYKELRALELKIAKEGNSNNKNITSCSGYAVPIVFHIVDQNPNKVTDGQVASAMNILNEDFNKLNAEIGSLDPNFEPIAADVGVSFKLAKIDPNGNTTTGIDRVVADGICASTTGGVDIENCLVKVTAPAWDTNKYLNIWIINDPYGGTTNTTNSSGWSFLAEQVPILLPGEDGIVYNHRFLGTEGSSDADQFLGDMKRTLTHEVGHYLNLHHTFKGYCGNNDDDFVLDTPKIKYNNCNVSNGTGCCPYEGADPIFWKSCDGITTVNYENYMDYSRCPGMFTDGQNTRMQASLQSSIRSTLVSPANQIATGICEETTSPYCESRGKWINDEYIQRVQLNTIDNNSGAASGYTDFTSISTNLAIESSYTITVTPKWVDQVYDEGYAVWIDYNSDGEFSGYERVWAKNPGTNTPNIGTFTLPSNSVLGTTRMRVSMKYNGVPDACETFNYGEVEDYTINIVEGEVSNETYCESKGKWINDEYIQRVQLNTIDNNSGAASGYTDFTDISTNLTVGSLYTITVTPKWVDQVYDEGYAVWIDYNNDGEFAGYERVWAKNPGTNTPNIGTFTLPSNSVLSTTRMRVSMKYNGVPTACETFRYGEVEDYTVTITNSSGNSGNEGLLSTDIDSVVLFPNPVNNLLSFQLKNQNMETFSITNMMGQKLISGKVTETTIDVSQLESGLYSIEFKSDTGTLSNKFIKQ